jgi:copper chaperone CopZ
MKTIISIVLLTIGLYFTAPAQIKKAQLQAAGLTCAMCSNATLKALETLPFVDKVDTDLDNSLFTLTFKPGAPVSIDAIKDKVQDAGFSVAKLILTASFDNVSIQPDAHVTYNGNTFHFIDVKQQVLNGDRNITVIDKDFVTARQFKKYSSETSMPCYSTGMMTNQRVYHVTI